MTKWNRNCILWIAGTLFLSAGIHYAAIVLYPYAIISSLQSRLLKRTPKNALNHASRPTAEDRVVVAPSPDLIYSVGVFDVSDAPLRITAPLTGSYMSVSLYASNTDNFLVKNDRQVEGKFDLVLVGPKATDPKIDGVQVVRSPSDTGIVLFRFFAGDGSYFEEIDSRRREIICTLLK